MPAVRFGMGTIRAIAAWRVRPTDDLEHHVARQEASRLARSLLRFSKVGARRRRSRSVAPRPRHPGIRCQTSRRGQDNQGGPPHSQALHRAPDPPRAHRSLRPRSDNQRLSGAGAAKCSPRAVAKRSASARSLQIAIGENGTEHARYALAVGRGRITAGQPADVYLGGGRKCDVRRADRFR